MIEIKNIKLVVKIIAEQAFKNCLDSRRQLDYEQSLDCMVLINNHPYRAASWIRPLEMKRIERRLKEIGIGVIARGEDGPVIDDSGRRYTTVLLLDCSDDREKEITAIAEEEFAEGEAEVEAIRRSMIGRLCPETAIQQDQSGL